MIKSIVRMLDSKEWEKGLCVFAVLLVLFGGLLGAHVLFLVSLAASLILGTLYFIQYKVKKSYLKP